MLRVAGGPTACRTPRRCAQLGPEPAGLRPGHGRQGGRGGVRAHLADQLLDQPGGVGPGPMEGAVEVHGGGPVGVVAGGDLQARNQLVGCGRRPPLPGSDDGGGLCVRPGEMDVGGDRGGGHGPEDEHRHHPEVAGAGPAERPEQVCLVVVVAPGDAAVGEHDLGPDEVVGGDAVPASQDPKAATQGQPRLWGTQTWTQPVSCEFASIMARWGSPLATYPRGHPGALEIHLRCVVSLHPAARAARPGRRHQGLGTPRPPPSAGRPAAVDPTSQAGAR